MNCLCLWNVMNKYICAALHRYLYLVLCCLDKFLFTYSLLFSVEAVVLFLCLKIFFSEIKKRFKMYIILDFFNLTIEWTAQRKDMKRGCYFLTMSKLILVKLKQQMIRRLNFLHALTWDNAETSNSIQLHSLKAVEVYNHL